MHYQLLKWVHMGAALITITGFLLRGFWSVIDSPKIHYRTTKILPHLVDTILFVSGIVLLIQMRYYPMQHHWMAMKLFVVLLYILNGFYVLKWAKSKRQKIIGLCIAIALFGYIVGLAYFKSLIL